MTNQNLPFQGGDVIWLTVTWVEAFGFWGIYDEATGFVSVADYKWDMPVLKGDEPRVGDKIQVRVIDESKEPEQNFYASIKWLHPELNPWHDPSVYRIGDIFTGTLEEVHPFGCWARHPRGADCRLIVNGVKLGLKVGQKVQAKIVGVYPEKHSLDIILVES
jgi:ribosomal protein S1